MKRFFLWLVLLSLGVGAGIAIHRDAGYLLVSYHHWVIEMPLWLGAVLLLMAFAFFYVLLAGLQQVAKVGQFFVRLGQKHRQQQARQRTNRGLIAFAEGHWAEAERLLVKGAGHSESPLLNYLTAARAAQEQGEHQRRDRYLRMAHDATPGTDVAVGLTQAQLQLSHGQLEQSLATLNHLRTLAPKHPYVLKLLKKIYEHLNEWEALSEVMPDLLKAKVITPEEANELELKIARALLDRMIEMRSTTTEALTSLWQRAPKALQSDLQAVCHYVNALRDRGEAERAEATLRLALKKSWHDEWILLYGLIKAPVPSKHLTAAEQWLKEQESNPALLLTLGRLSLRAQLWGKAQRYFEASLSLKASAQAHAELARLLDRLGKAEESAKHYRQGLLLAAPVIPLDREMAAITAAQ